MATSGTGRYPSGRVGSTYSSHYRDQAAVSPFLHLITIIDRPTYVNIHWSAVGSHPFACLLSHQFIISYVNALSPPPQGTPAAESKLDHFYRPWVYQWNTNQSKLVLRVKPNPPVAIIAHTHVSTWFPTNFHHSARLSRCR